MPASKIRIKVKKFRPIGALTTTTVEMELRDPNPVPPAGARASEVTDGEVTKIGSYFIRSKKGGNPLELKFWLVDDALADTDAARYHNFVVLGIAFINRDQNSEPTSPSDPDTKAGRVGQHRFIKVEIALEPAHGLEPAYPEPEGKLRVMTVTNNRNYDENESFDYMILVQEAASGAIGIIDPEYENEV